MLRNVPVFRHDPPVVPGAEAALALAALAPLMAWPDAPDAFRGRWYEYVGEGDPLADEADRASRDFEGLALRPGLGFDVETALAKVTSDWIEAQVESAILQSAPERAMSELAATGRTEDLIFAPPAPVAELRVPGLTLRPLVAAVDTDARRLARDPLQEEHRARALVLADERGRTSNQPIARVLAEEIGERVRLEQSGDLDDKRQKRLDELMRDHRRGRRSEIGRAHV